MKVNKSVLYPLGALVLVAVFWAGAVIATRSIRQPESLPPPPSDKGPAPQVGSQAGQTSPEQMPAIPATRTQSSGFPSSAAPPAGDFGGQPNRSGENDTESVPEATPSRTRPVSAATGIFVNNRELNLQQVEQIRAIYGFVAPAGRYWYDPRSGLWGVMGREAAGIMQPGHAFGPMPANPSNGNTGVFINGREINMVEAAYLQQIFGAVYQGHWWLDGRTGNLGIEGNPTPVANVYLALRQSQSRGGQGYSWHSKTTGAYGGSDGACSYVSIPGSGTVMSGACD